MSSRVRLTTDTIRSQVADCLRVSPYKGKIKSTALFGSYVQGAVKGNSDVDLLIVFNNPAGYFTLVRIQQELSQALHSEVDLVTKDALSPHLREEILKEAVVIYEK